MQERDAQQTRLDQTMTEDRRATLHDVRGVLAYLELPPSESQVHERDCKWPHDVGSNGAQAVRRHTTHTIGNARRYHDLSLRSCGFQLFGSGDGVPMAPPSQHSGAAAGTGGKGGVTEGGRAEGVATGVDATEGDRPRLHTSPPSNQWGGGGGRGEGLRGGDAASSRGGRVREEVEGAANRSAGGAAWTGRGGRAWEILPATSSTRVFPGCLILMASCDVASNSCQAPGGGGLAPLHTRGAILEYVRNVEAFVLTVGRCRLPPG